MQVRSQEFEVSEVVEETEEIEFFVTIFWNDFVCAQAGLWRGGVVG